MTPEARRMIAYYERQIEVERANFESVQHRYDTPAILEMARAVKAIERYERKIIEFQIGKVLS